MNERLTELYKTCRPKEALASQEQFNSANVLLGTEVEKFAELIVRECIDTVLDSSVEYATRPQIAEELKEHFGVKE